MDTADKPADFTPDSFALRTTNAAGRSYGDFQWPREVGAIVTCPDWSDRAECGNGLHAIADGLGDYALLSDAHDALWWIVSFVRAEAVELDGKVKFPRCRVEYVGAMGGAMTMISQYSIKRILAEAKGNTATGYRGHAAATGDSGHAAATGYSGHAAATGDSGHAAATGDRGHAAATGDSGHAAATGYRGHAAATGDSGHAAATGDSGHAAATGDSGHAAATGYSGHAAATGKHAIAASLGYAGKAKAGPNGAIALAVYNDDGELVAVRAAMVGQDGIEPNVWYSLGLDGQFVRAE
jgi:hypothetical protein